MFTLTWNYNHLARRFIIACLLAAASDSALSAYLTTHVAAPEPAGGGYSAPTYPLAEFGEGQRGEGKEGEGRGRKRKRGRRGEGKVEPQAKILATALD